MTDTRDSGGQAFPTHPILYGSADQHLAQGMSLRDWFAGQALAGAMVAIGNEPARVDVRWWECAADCYRAADAMLEARK
jgi:hypothetical protein